MRVTSRGKAIAFFITFSSCVMAAVITLNISWIVLNWRRLGLLVLGIIFFGIVMAGLVLNTIFLVREIRRNEQQDSFLHAVTHELKTPLTSIRLYLQTLQSRNVDEVQRQEFYRVMLSDSDRLLSTVEQVLHAAELSHPPAKLEDLIDMEGLVRECLEEARTHHHLSPESLRLLVATGEGEAKVTGNKEELRSAISNLLDNAIKYSGEKVDVEVELAATDKVLLRVRDRGIGIPRADLKQVFKRFYRVKDREVARVKGSGLGLFIVRSIAKKYGGNAFAESDGPGSGATITIQLPRAI
ncbi:MAG: HAMP domain-containing histidine kinase [Acidobacteria bacterium]|nr:HAMP domain-containing histidine kinase [Acidobacteriota bacterium]MBV9147483.1 HAMP domain-containing histidine kinase [Acidobacteriota bacterium]MBV9436054.1 HAMP domain-containing histidine kinase [Acidobacteriota bacterium]